VLAAGLTVAVAPAVSADDLDASVTRIPSGSQGSPQMAQVFTALHTGALYQIALDAGFGFNSIPVSIEVHSISSGVPSADAMTTIAAPTSTDVLSPNIFWRTYTLSPRVQVVAGTQYAIVTRAGTYGTLGNYFHWGYTTLSNANFSGGKMLVRFSDSGTWLPLGTSSWAFDFQTWVSTATGPTITANVPAGATGPEGTRATEQGTYSDNGGTVTLSADHGSVTPTTGTGGTWTWTGDLWDEDTAPSTITVTATDAAGVQAKAPFPLTVTKTKPSVAIGTTASASGLAPSTQTISRPEGGSALTLYANVTSPDPTDQAQGFKYRWDVTKNGVAMPVGTSASYMLANTDEATYVVTLTATDDGGAFDTTSSTVVWTENRPDAQISSVTPSDSTLSFIAPGETLTFTGTDNDPSPEGHTYHWDFGDGTPSSTDESATHAYSAGGVYTVTLTVTDDEGTFGLAATTTVKVLTPQQSLDAMIKYVRGLKSLSAGEQNSLIAKLQAASDALARGDNRASHNQLNAFINELDADLKTGKISARDYNTLRADAHAVQGATGTYNRFVEWWPLAA